MLFYRYAIEFFSQKIKSILAREKYGNPYGSSTKLGQFVPKWKQLPYAKVNRGAN
jgi:hypothetical protein